MRKIRDISEDEMIAVFLQAELNSVRFRQDIEAYLQQERIDPHILHAPDWRNAQENALRRAILGIHRGYGRNEGYFIGFPTDVRWERVTLTREELEQVRYVNGNRQITHFANLNLAVPDPQYNFRVCVGQKGSLRGIARTPRSESWLARNHLFSCGIAPNAE